MNFQQIALPKFSVVGIAVRTTNQDGQSQKDIGELWGKFMSENIIAQIPNKERNDIYCVYTDYESDFMGAYTTLIGCKVSSIVDVPSSFVIKTIPECIYQLYISEGKLPDCVMNTWQYIWQNPLPRSYVADFDVYGIEAQNPIHAKVSSFVSIK